MQHLLTTMIILAAYYTLADIILWIQCIWYSGNGKMVDEATSVESVYETDPLLQSRRDVITYIPDNGDSEVYITTIPAKEVRKTNMSLNNLLIVFTVIFAGFISWYIPYCSRIPVEKTPDLRMNWLAQVFGYLGAVLYLGSRIPQIILNFKRRSCEGVSFLFFLFACLGNIMFITSVLVVSLDPEYLLVNFSWLLGSAGTLFLDLVIFSQFFLYGDKQHSHTSAIMRKSKLRDEEDFYSECSSNNR